MKFLVVDDHFLIREALSALLRELAPEAEVFTAGDAAAAQALLQSRGDMDLVLLDIQLPGTDGLSLLREWRASRPAMAVAMLSGLRDAAAMRQALALGASGYIPKTETREVMASALRLVLAGGVYVPRQALGDDALPAGTSPLARAASPEPRAASGPQPPGLTGRQAEVLALLMRGYSNKRICRALDLAEPTVKNHVTAILRTLGVSSRTEAVLRITQAQGLPPAAGRD